MKFISTNVQETYYFAETLALGLKGNEVILLNGELGSGKTTFTKGLFLSLGVNKNVTSPTFTILKEYQGEKYRLYHLDMYRLNTQEEAFSIGIDEIFGEKTIVVIEWNKIKHFEGKVINININYIDENTREFFVEEKVINEKYYY